MLIEFAFVRGRGQLSPVISPMYEVHADCVVDERSFQLLASIVIAVKFTVIYNIFLKKKNNAYNVGRKYISHIIMIKIHVIDKFLDVWYIKIFFGIKIKDWKNYILEYIF